MLIAITNTEQAITVITKILLVGFTLFFTSGIILDLDKSGSRSSVIEAELHFYFTDLID